MGITETAIIFSAIGTVVIAVATTIYTIFSARTINELQKQRKLIEEENRSRYELERKNICRKLLREINNNQNTLFFLNIILTYDLKDDIEKEKDDEIEPQYYLSYLDDLELGTYEKFLDMGLGFKNDNLMDDIDSIYDQIKILKDSFVFWIKKAGKKGFDKYKSIFLKTYLDIVNKILEEIDVLYDEFKEEIDYDHRKSKFYFSVKQIADLTLDHIIKKLDKNLQRKDNP